MENGQKKLSELFNGRKIFNIPKYQRSYAWEERKQLRDFLDDVYNQKLGRDYFLGTILFQENPTNDGGFEVIDIVDGQQRITTVIIFMSVLIDRLKDFISEDEKDDLELLIETYIQYKNKYKLRILPDDNDFFQSYILNDCDGNDFIRTPSQEKLYKAKKYFEQALDGKTKDELIELKKKVDENTKVLTYSVQDTSEATLIFETTNDRGKGLTNLEKIKSFLMYQCYLVEEDDIENLLNKIQYRFSDIYKEFDKISSQIDEDSILQYHFIAHEKWTEKEHYQNNVDTVKQHLNGLVKNSQDKKAIKFIERYTKELKETFFAISNILSLKSESIRDIFILNRPANFYPLLIKAFKYDTTLDKNKFDTLTKKIEKFIFRVYSINQNRSDTGQSSVYTLARDFKGDFNFVISEIIRLTNLYCDDTKFELNLEAPNFYEIMNSRDLNYFFWKYENYLRGKIQPIASQMSEEEFLNKNPKLRLTIEHIASQNPKVQKVIATKSILPRMTQEFQRKYLHSIGNLTIDPQSANSSKGNNNFQYKNSKYFIKAPLKTQNELESFLVNRKWDKKPITKRKEKLIKFALDYWKVVN